MFHISHSHTHAQISKQAHKDIHWFIAMGLNHLIYRWYRNEPTYCLLWSFSYGNDDDGDCVDFQDMNRCIFSFHCKYLPCISNDFEFLLICKWHALIFWFCPQWIAKKPYNIFDEQGSSLYTKMCVHKSKHTHKNANAQMLTISWVLMRNFGFSRFCDKIHWAIPSKYGIPYECVRSVNIYEINRLHVRKYSLHFHWKWYGFMCMCVCLNRAWILDSHALTHSHCHPNEDTPNTKHTHTNVNMYTLARQQPVIQTNCFRTISTVRQSKSRLPSDRTVFWELNQTKSIHTVHHGNAYVVNRFRELERKQTSVLLNYDDCTEEVAFEYSRKL